MVFLKNHKILLIVVAIIVAFIAYTALTGVEDEPLLVTTVVASPQTPAAAAEQGLVSLLLELQALSLDGTLFTTPRFMGLSDFGQELSPQPVGRPNPFAPIGSVQ